MSHFFGLDARRPEPVPRVLGSAIGAVQAPTNLERAQRIAEDIRSKNLRIQKPNLGVRELLGGRPYSDLFYDDFATRAIVRDPGSPGPGYVYYDRAQELLKMQFDNRLANVPPRSIFMERQLNNPDDRARTLAHEMAHLMSFDVLTTDWAKFSLDADREIANYRERRAAPTEEQPWTEMRELMHRFPGVADNSFEDPDNPWGGPTELFATMAQMSDGVLERIPPEMRGYFKNILGDPTDDWPAYVDTPQYNTSMWHRQQADQIEALRRELFENWEDLPKKEKDLIIEEWLEAQRPTGLTPTTVGAPSG